MARQAHHYFASITSHLETEPRITACCPVVRPVVNSNARNSAHAFTFIYSAIAFVVNANRVVAVR